MLRLRLDEGGGEVLKNSAPHAQTASFPIGKFEAAVGRDDLAVARLPHGDAARTSMLGQTGDYEMEPGILVGRMVHAAFRAELQHREQCDGRADREDGHDPAQPRLGLSHRARQRRAWTW